MRHLPGLLAPLVAIFMFCAAAIGEDIEVKAGDGTNYVFHCPDSLSAKKNNPPEGIPPTIKAKNAKMSLQITFMPAGKVALENQAAINALVGKIGSGQYEGGSVEKKTTVIELKVAGGIGAIAQYTDADLANVADPRPGQYKVVATGIIVLGKNVAAITLLGDEFASADYKQGLALLESGFTVK